MKQTRGREMKPVVRSVEIDFLIFCLRRKLDEVDQAIVELERKARTQRGTAPRRRPLARERLELSGTRERTSHCRRAG